MRTCAKVRKYLTLLTRSSESALITGYGPWTFPDDGMQSTGLRRRHYRARISEICVVMRESEKRPSWEIKARSDET